MTVIDAGREPHHQHPPHVAHHWDSAQQQFEAGKLGMWLFLATEVLLFGGLFCAYAVSRANHPELFAYGAQFLDVRWGALNTVVLILSSMTMALAVSAAQLSRPRALVVLLSATFVGGLVFMCIKYVEYAHKFHENLTWGTTFYETPTWYVPETLVAVAGDGAAAPVAAAALAPGDAVAGEAIYRAVCRTCHGAAGEGVSGQGKAIGGSVFIAGKTDEEMLAFLKIGRPVSDPLNTTGVAMLPRGGNPLLRDQDLMNVLAYVRTLPAPAGGPEGGEDGADGTEAGAGPAAAAPEAEFWIPRSSIPVAPRGPAGAVALADVGAGHGVLHYPHHSVDPKRPANAHLFFGIYFCMTGLHGLHVIAGMGVIAWLIYRAARGHFSGAYFTPVDLGGLYWHVVDLIWIFLFPLLYLIG